METTATQSETAGKPFLPPLAWRVIAAPRGERPNNLLRAWLEWMNAAAREVPAEFCRFPFP